MPNRLPFEVAPQELLQDIDAYVDRVFRALESDFLFMPQGDGFVDFEAFAEAYDCITAATAGFHSLDPNAVMKAVRELPMTLVVLRTILGFSPPEWADVASTHGGETITQGYVRGLDRSIRKAPNRGIARTELQERRIFALVEAACDLLSRPAPRAPAQIHRLDKIDTHAGSRSLAEVASEGVPYASLLYERFLGRPFASHRDSVSELVGGILEDRIAEHLSEAGIPFHQTTSVQPLEEWEQLPDFLCPDAAAPVAVIEAKMTQDDGTARDKVARVRQLAAIRDERVRRGEAGFDVVACIAGRGFGVRRADMKALLSATRGKTFTLSQVDRIAECTRLSSLAVDAHPHPDPPTRD